MTVPDMLGTYKEDGFKLQRGDNNMLVLYSPDNIKVAIFNALTVTKETIQSVCFDWRTKIRRREYGTRKPYKRRGT